MNQEGVLACCAVCNQQTHRRCGRCLNVYYCNTEHQRQDWKRHKSECAPKLQKQSSRKDKVVEQSSIEEKELKIRHEEDIKISLNNKEDILQAGSELRRLKKSKKKITNKEGSDIFNDNKNTSQSVDSIAQTVDASSAKGNLKDKSVFSSVVYSNKDIAKISAITYEGSSEQQILSEKAQQLNSVDFEAASTSNLLKEVNRTDVKMPAIPSEQPTRMKEYPEAILKGSGAPYNNYFMDTSDPNYNICQRVIRDMTQYGVCVLNNFLGKERGLLVLKEVLDMYQSGIFTVSNFL